jgi:carbamoyltransferase
MPNFSMETYYIGLANTFHDPAMAIIDSTGKVVYAEASERYLQYKRAVGCAADERETVHRVLRDHCDPQARFVIAKPWSSKVDRSFELMRLIGATNHERLPRRSESITKFLFGKHVLFSQAWLQFASFQLSGGHLADILRISHGNGNVHYVRFPHHLAHAANAAFTGPFTEAAVMVVDGQGEGGSITYFDYRNGKLKEVHRVRGEHSLGILYTVCTQMCGFDSEKGEEWKMMGLAPYGKVDENILEDFRSLVQVDGLNIKYRSLRHVRNWFQRMQPRTRAPDASPIQAADLACTTQHFYAEVMSMLLTRFHALGLSDNLVLGGGCALNSSYNGQILDRTPFRHLHVPCAPADDGNALGAAFLAYQQEHPDRDVRVSIQSPYLGAEISTQTLEHLVKFGQILKSRHLPGTVYREAARLLAEGKLLGWVQGRAEFGPRALGNRSILADPRPADMKDRINSLVKFREEFRPFAPSILDEYGDEYFKNYQVTPYMDRTLTFREWARAKVPAVAHVNGTGRLQSVRREWNERFYDLIRAFHELTGVPILLNTSFNIMGKPIIHSVEDAVALFYTTGLDALVIGDYLFEK